MKQCRETNHLLIFQETVMIKLIRSLAILVIYLLHFTLCGNNQIFCKTPDVRGMYNT